MRGKRIETYLRPLKPLPTGILPRGELIAPIACILFDLYGTLIISASGHLHTQHRDRTEALAQVSLLLKQYGLDRSAAGLVEHLHAAIEKQHHAARSAGIAHPEIRIDHIWRHLLGGDLEQEDLLRFATAFEMIMNPVWPMPNARELLRTCADRGVLRGIISNAQFYTLELFDLFFGGRPDKLGFHPDLTIFSYRRGEAKPSATLFNLARDRIKSMGFESHHVVYVGNDMRNDIEPARQAGFQTVLFAGDQRSLRLRQDDLVCQAAEPDMIITDLNQLQSYVTRADILRLRAMPKDQTRS